MTLESLLPWLPLLNLIVFPVAGWVIKALRKDLASSVDLREQAERITSLDQRIALVERDLQHLPDGQDFEELRKWMSQMAAETKAQGTQLASLAAAVTRIEDYLLKRQG